MLRVHPYPQRALEQPSGLAGLGLPCPDPGLVWEGVGTVLFKLSQLGWVQQLGALKGPRARETERRGRLNLELIVRGARQMGHGRGWKWPRRGREMVTNNEINNNSDST